MNCHGLQKSLDLREMRDVLTSAKLAASNANGWLLWISDEMTRLALNLMIADQANGSVRCDRDAQLWPAELRC
jgi:hypothetical protein